MISDEEYVRLRNEYHITVRALAVLTETILQLTGWDAIEVDDETLLHGPQLRAYRDGDNNVIRIELDK